MNRFVFKFQQLDRRIFKWINGRLHNRFFNFLLFYLTHLGGATFTIGVSVLTWLLAPEPWKTAGAISAVALAISHIPVAIAKRLYPRNRPYLALPETNTFRNPLTDHSFPSGHTTAAFAVAVTFMSATSGLLLVILLLLCITVGFSRIYLGLHYPSDVIAGAVIGSSVAGAAVALWI